jgi:hypothetical protein
MMMRRVLRRPRAALVAGIWPCLRPVLLACCILAFVATLLTVGSDLLLDWFPTGVHVTSDGSSMSVSVGGMTNTVEIDRPVQSLTFEPIPSYDREYQIDGSDSTNNLTYDGDYFAQFSTTPYYRFQAWLRDEGSYSSWRNLVIRDDGQHVIARDARPESEVARDLPPAFDLTVDFHRMEAPRAITFGDDAGGQVHLEVNRNDKWVQIARLVPGEPDEQLANWYLPFDWLPELAEVLYLLMRSCALALWLVVLLVPLAAILPRRILVVPGRLTQVLVPVLALALALGTTLYLTIFVLDRRTHIYDAMSYYFQAKTFASGMVAAPNPAVPEAFWLPFTVHNGGKWFSMYSPGTALVLAVGFLVGVPWLIEPLLAIAGALLVYGFARRQYGLHTALLAVVLMASSPFLRLQAASFMSHVPGMFWGALLFYAATRYSEKRATVWAITGAAALGFLMLTREMSAILYAATLGAYWAWRWVVAWRRAPGDRRRQLGDLAAVILCLALFAGVYLAYNKALTGSLTTLPRTLFSVTENKYGFGEGVGFYGRHTPGAGLVNADEMLTSLTIYLFGWPFYVSLALIALPFLLRRARTWDFVHGAVVGGFVLAYIGLYYHGIAYGPRYYFDAMPSLVLLSARGFVVLAEAAAAIFQRAGWREAWPRARTAALILCIALLACGSIYFWPQQARLYRPVSDPPGAGDLALSDFLQQSPVVRKPGEHPAMIVTRTRDLMESFGPMNCPRLDCQTIFAFSPSEETDQKLRAAYPGRDWYSVRSDNGKLVAEVVGQMGAPPTR